MGTYGKSAILAVKLIDSKQVRDPLQAWERATSILMKNKWSQKKNCPRGAFLGLCEEGLVKGIPKGDYTRSVKNKGYAVKAVELLHQTSTLPKKSELWGKITGNKIAYSGQLDVVLSLWDNDLILKK